MYRTRFSDRFIVDNTINVVTQRAAERDMHNMTLHGVELPNSEQMEDYIMDLRAEVQRVLEQSN